MATKQGLSAQISQASEDAKRAVLQHAPLKSSWFSNLNTTCTIKSAPPRTPEVLNLLSYKSGWLWKRNEQHVWQARWCCVVPHTFLYYFDSSGRGTAPPPPPPLTQRQQEALNGAVKSGFGDKPHSGPRTSFSVFQQATPINLDTNKENPDITVDKSPVGIIDLECYASVRRSSENAFVMELTGDDCVNPDLRSFYFFAEGDQESVDWTQAFLQNRHGALQDELDAFREVAAGFASQLQELHVELDDQKQTNEETSNELYAVRSAAEETRRTCFRILCEAMERDYSKESPFSKPRKAYRQDLETARDLGLVPAVQLLSDYLRVLEEQCTEQASRNNELQQTLQASNDSDATQVTTLRETLDRQQREWSAEKSDLEKQVASLQKALKSSQKALEDAQQEMASQRLEMTMYQNQTKQRLGELLSHKRILKQEVLGLRKKLDDERSELHLLKHTSKTSLDAVHQERRKSELLERYVERMESQVRVQQNMMELMSQQSGAASVIVHGTNHGNGSQAGNSFHSYSPNYATNKPRKYDDDSEIQKEHARLLQRAREMALVTEDEEKDVVVEEEEEKSHMSELTEDRTQKQFDAAFHRADDSPVISRRRTPKRLPSYIGVQEEVKADIERENGEDQVQRRQQPTRRCVDNDLHANTHKNNDHRLDTIMSASLPPPRVLHRHSPSGSSAAYDNNSVGSTGKLSVAQRARLEAENRVSTPVHVRAPPLQQKKSSVLANLGKSLSAAIDQSIGADSSSTDAEGSSGSFDERGRYSNGTPRSDAGASEVSEATAMSLQERQTMQRAKQLAFLKEQGLITDDSKLRGGAGATPPSPSRH